MLTILGIIFLIILSFWGGRKAVSSIAFHKTYGLGKNKVLGYSWPAQEILKQYLTVPPTNRPYANIAYLLSALDTKHDVATVNEHFQGTGKRFNWVTGQLVTEETPRWCGCGYARGSFDAPRKSQCRYSEYHDIRQALKEVNESLERQRRTLEVANVSDGLSQVKDFTEALRRERNLVDDVTRELS